MEKYIYHGKVSEDNLGCIYKVTEKDDKTNKAFLLKEIECLDVITAQSTIDELRVFHRINHKFLSRLHDSFVKWDKKISSAFVCFVNDLYGKKDLMTLLNEMRTKKEEVQYQTVKRWLGSIVDGINYIHQNELCHRNLKPSSLYIGTLHHKHDLHNAEHQNEKTKLIIDSYGAATPMKDALTKTRNLPGSFDYQAPEVFDTHSFNYAADIWTIGTVLLDICTTSLYDHKTFHLHLLSLRYDDELFSQILNDIQHVYSSKSLVKVLKQLLDKNSETRITIRKLVGDEFIQECLREVESSLANNVSTQKSKAAIPLPKEHSVKEIISFLNNSIQNEQGVEEGIKILNRLADYELLDLSVYENQQLLFKLMDTFVNNPHILSNAFNVLEKSLEQYIQNNSKKDLHLSSKFLEKIFYLFLKYGDSKEVLIAVVRAFSQLANFEEPTNRLASYNVIKYLLDVLNRFDTEADLCVFTCRAIWCLCASDSIMRTISNLKSLLTIRNTIIKHQKNPKCFEMACNVVIALSMDETLIINEEINVDVTSVILIALQHHLDLRSVVKSACVALSSLVAILEECAFRFLYVPATELSSDIDGIGLIRLAYSKHKDVSEIVKEICIIFKELCNYDEMILELKSLKLNEKFTNEIILRYRDNIQIYDVCVLINEKIENK